MGNGKSRSKDSSNNSVSPTQSVLAPPKRRQGQSFHDMYEMGEHLGTGSFGDVNMARFLNTRQGDPAIEVAVKFVCKDDVHDYDEAVRQIQSEYELLSKLQHPHIIRFHDFFNQEPNGDMLLVLELCEGGEFLDMIAIQEPAFSEKMGAKIMADLLSGLEYLHKQRIVHHDLKVGNLLLRRKNDVRSIVIADFGLACQLDKDDEEHATCRGSTLSDLFCGSAGPYLAPELLKLGEMDMSMLKAGKIGSAVDIWCMGVIAHITMCGKEPKFTNTWSSDDDDMHEIREENVNQGTEYHFDDVRREQQAVGLSEMARQFIGSMLEYDSQNRPTATQLINHEWIRAHSRE